MTKVELQEKVKEIQDRVNDLNDFALSVRVEIGKISDLLDELPDPFVIESDFVPDVATKESK